MAITYTIIFDVLPAEHDRFLSLLNGVLDAMRAEPMFRQAALHRDPSSPYRYMLYETWDSHQDVLDVQLQRPYRTAWHAALPTLLTRDRDIAMWEPVRRDGWG
ncbi:antibiotic biosynthesis monooxygenase [Sphingomonas sp. So64.6b]|uniref:putative quinol monooxygenase n=1 Tax=Sphingomonas sp. So64.6b TaxID=2997354 RepID=UPI00160432CC|nr:putative quinol monooxygenase [Sphingomonas sp. So64.6b]QNA83550.1 antibiotic biosynthesis monooxygenase [Sphingomonas sp. So64.6b]